METSPPAPLQCGEGRLEAEQLADMTYSRLATVLLERLETAKLTKANPTGKIRQVEYYLGEADDLLEDVRAFVPTTPAAFLTLASSKAGAYTLLSSEETFEIAVVVFAENLRSARSGATGEGGSEYFDKKRLGALDLAQIARDTLHVWPNDQTEADIAEKFTEPVMIDGIEYVNLSPKTRLTAYVVRFTAGVQIDRDTTAPAIKEATLTSEDADGEPIHESTIDPNEEE